MLAILPRLLQPALLVLAHQTKRRSGKPVPLAPPAIRPEPQAS
jgi:hypothetical protein